MGSNTALPIYSSLRLPHTVHWAWCITGGGAGGEYRLEAVGKGPVGAGVFEGQCGGFTRGELACDAALSAYRSQHKTGGEVARMEVPVDGVLGNYYIAGGRGI